MRIIHTSDWHLGKSLEGVSRMEEQERFLQDFVRLAVEHRADLVIIAGDVYDSVNPPSRAESLFYETLKQLSDEGRRLTLVIAGNHDAPERLAAAGPLAREHGILLVGTPGTVLEPGPYGRHRLTDSGQGFLELEIRGERAVILTVPYPSEKRLNEVLYTDADDEAARAAGYGDRLKRLFRELSSRYRPDTVNLAVSHLFALGSEEAGSERSIQLGGTYLVWPDCFPEGAQYVALGHVHKPQAVPGTGGRVRYSGSPLHFSRKEAAFGKSCFLVEVSPGREAAVTALPLPVYKPIEVWRCGSFQEALDKAQAAQDRPCWAYVEIQTDSYLREDQIKALRSLKRDILEITPVFERGLAGASAPEELTEQSFETLFRAFYGRERGVEPEEELVSLLLSIVDEA